MPTIRVRHSEGPPFRMALPTPTLTLPSEWRATRYGSDNWILQMCAECAWYFLKQSCQPSVLCVKLGSYTKVFCISPQEYSHILPGFHFVSLHLNSPNFNSLTLNLTLTLILWPKPNPKPYPNCNPLTIGFTLTPTMCNVEFGKLKFSEMEFDQMKGDRCPYGYYIG